MKTSVGRPSVEAQRREQILDAFEQCVMEFGLDKTSLQKVATQAELPRSLVRYFVGNREDMIELLLQRMHERAEQSLIDQFPENPDLSELLDFLFDSAFTNNTSNQIVDQLWQLSNRDPKIKTQLKNLYSTLRQRIVEQMSIEKLPQPSLHSDVVQSLIALAYGEASFVDIGLKTKKRDMSRRLANIIISDLKRGSK